MIFCAASSNSSGSAMRVMTPRSYMRCAGNGSPSNRISRLATGPQTSTSFLARNQVGARPICDSDMPKRALVEATTKSQCSASSLPPAIAAPCTTPTIGSGQCSIASSMPSTGLTPGWAGLRCRSARSIPAQKTGPSARSTMTRSSLAGVSEKASFSAASISRFIALRFAGRVSVTVRIAPSLSTRIMLMGGASIRCRVRPIQSCCLHLFFAF